ncbi:CAMK family protein kinase [Trichomonas vaginalis G3]|uniref:CAMK family protein kinase n=1 Tax=Trichomonas vaginalis (strain ATCC PRA-98 / G3) TaxID=412133 RepID=A2DZE9_TRIV3|nr:protein serine/threonine kinase protein [Trichomonas vaginalis G3]EAY14278.1 CAMK family protein kinase [Trichomonas vaginalis G3]KAI5491861.1 protein serine/threonine kinase protein [Trichomonas vaginalis G3]|eukprot:XP_001326501.1 CAMK family protein kinase [Trichomonas vaginalis G3]
MIINDAEIEDDLKQHGYQVVRLIASSSVAKHFEVSNAKGFTFDVKVYNHAAASNIIDYYNNEKDILGTLIHPNIVETFDFFQTQNYSYLVFELCRDLSLESIVSSTRKCSEKNVYVYLSQLIQGIEYLHSNNIVHNNLNPSTIHFDRFGRIKIVDFDYASISYKQNSDRCPHSRYSFSPETYSGKPYDPRASDVWSFGAISYYLLSGQYPWSNNSEISYSDSLESSMKNLYGKYDEKLIQLILDCLSEDPSKRPLASVANSFFMYTEKQYPISKKFIRKQNSNQSISKIKRNSSSPQFRACSSLYK